MKNFREILFRWAQAILRSQLVLCRVVLGKGFIKMNFQLFSQLVTAPSVLRVLGATVGQNSHIYADICVYNADGASCHNLIIGSNVYIGPRCLFDLTEKIVVDDDASVSAQVSFITHLDVGNQPLKKVIPRRQGPIHVARGAWIGVNSTVLHDVTIGEFAMVGAMSLVNKSLPATCLALGIPATVVRDIGGQLNSDVCFDGVR